MADDWDLDQILHREELAESLIGSPKPPASMVQRRMKWERARPRPKHIATRLGDALYTISMLPQWPAQRTAADRRKVIASEMVKEAERYDPGGGGLLIVGPSGAGKTTGVVHLLFSLWERVFTEQLKPWPNVTWMKAAALGSARRAHPLGAGEPKIVTDAIGAELLCLDDLGQEPKHDNVIFEVMDARYEAQRPSIVTSGFNVQQLTERYSEATIRRIVETRTRGKIVNLFKAPLAS